MTSLTTPLTRDTIQNWLDELSLESSLCSDCEGLHLVEWESKDGVLESRCFLDDQRCSLLTEVAIRPSAVLPLQGAIHFMNYDYGFIKVLLSVSDDDVPRLILTHSLPSSFLTAEQFNDWLPQLFNEMETVYHQLVDMDVLLTDTPDSRERVSDQLH